MDWIVALFREPTVAHSVLTLALVIAIGLALGNVRVRGVSLGIGGVLFAGLALGHLGLTLDVHTLEFVREFGLILFVYAMGLQLGGGFFSSLRRQGLTLNLLAASIVVGGTALALGLTWLFDVPLPTAVGLLSGAVTNTPGMGAAQHALVESGAGPETAQLVGLGYAVAYPFGILGTILALLLLKRLFRFDPAKEGAEFERLQSLGTKPLALQNLEVTNANLSGQTIGQLVDLAGGGVVVSRLVRRAEQRLATADVRVEVGDVLRVVGTTLRLERLRLIAGRVSERDLPAMPSVMTVRRVVVTKGEHVARTLDELDLAGRYGVVITRVVRAGVEFSPTRSMKLQFGDRLNVVGSEPALEGVARELGDEVKELDRAQFVPIFLGIALGVLLGSLPVALPGMPAPVKLGLAGGPLLVALLMGRIGKVGPFVSYVPNAAKKALAELGIALFLACVGVAAGAKVGKVLLTSDGLLWLCLGALVTFVPIVVVGTIARAWKKLDAVSLYGLLAGSMTDPPALAYSSQLVGNDTPSIAYATVYPLTMLLRVVLAQAVVLFGVGSASAAPPSPFAAVAGGARPGIVTVTGYDKGEMLLRSRPGFFLGDAHIVTVRHPLIGAQRVDVTLADGAVFPVTGVEAEDATVDLVLLKIGVPSDPLSLGARYGSRRALRWASERPAAGDLVIVVSDVDGAAGVTAGTLAAYKELPGIGAVLELDVDLAGRWEGSPVLDYDGQVLGVASVGYDGGQKRSVSFLATRLAVLKADEPSSVIHWSNQAQAAITKSGPDLYAFGRAAVAASNLEVALARLEQAVMKSPGHADAWVALGVVKARLERWDEAIECFERVVRLSRDHAEGQTNLCLALAHLERWTTAQIRCDEARRLSPDDPRVIFQQAHVLDALGSWEGALAGYNRVLELQPASLEAHYARGVVLAGRGRYPAAVESFQALCRLDASHRDALRRLGDALQGTGQHHEATEAYLKAIEVHGPDAQVYARLGQSWLALNQAGKALAAFEQAVRLQPSEVKTFFALGQAFTHLQRPDQAATMFRQALRLNERYTAAWFELGEVLQGQARHAEAEDAYQRCLDLDDRHVGARYGLGLTHLTRGDRDAAWEQVRRLQPLDAARSRALADLIIQPGL